MEIVIDTQREVREHDELARIGEGIVSALRARDIPSVAERIRQTPPKIRFYRLIEGRIIFSDKEEMEFNVKDYNIPFLAGHDLEVALNYMAVNKSMKGIPRKILNKLGFEKAIYLRTASGRGNYEALFKKK